MQKVLFLYGYVGCLECVVQNLSEFVVFHRHAKHFIVFSVVTISESDYVKNVCQRFSMQTPDEYNFS